MPSVVMGDGTPVFDHLGPWFTLACFGVNPSETLIAAAAKRGVPMTVIRCEERDLTNIYGQGLLLVRPDQHIAWRGSGCDDPRVADVWARVLGWPEGTR